MNQNDGKTQKKPAQRHEKVVSHILNSIFTGKLEAGTKLPTEVKLSEELGVDRTSLRVALKQIESMQLLEIRQGDGIYVRDYLDNAGLDFLRILALSHEKENSHIEIDRYLFDELWEFWTAVLPEIIKMAAKKTSPRDIKILINMIAQEKDHIGDMDKIIHLELAQQDYLARATKNLIIILLFNSSRPLRRRMLEIIYNAITGDDLKKHIDYKILLLNEFSGGGLAKTLDELNKYGLLLLQYQGKIREYFRKDSQRR
ncbi:MAG: GntR family transcriptional regulator [Desulfobacterales bacterium]